MADSEQFFDKVTMTDEFGDTVLNFGFEANHIIIANDGTGVLTFSWNGQTGTNDGEITATDKSIAMDGMEKSKVFLKTDNPGDTARVWAWKGEA